VRGPVFLHPAADGRLVEPVFTGHVGNRSTAFDHQPGYFVPKLWFVFLVFPCQFLGPFPNRTLFGPQSGKWEARHGQHLVEIGGCAYSCCDVRTEIVARRVRDKVGPRTPYGLRASAPRARSRSGLGVILRGPVLGWGSWAVSNVAYQDAPPSTLWRSIKRATRAGASRVSSAKARGGT